MDRPNPNTVQFELGFDTLYVTAHNMGGLVARSYILQTAAEVALKVNDYPMLKPSSPEELISYGHQSGKLHIQMLMQWKAEHIE